MLPGGRRLLLYYYYWIATFRCWDFSIHFCHPSLIDKHLHILLPGAWSRLGPPRCVYPLTSTGVEVTAGRSHFRLYVHHVKIRTTTSCYSHSPRQLLRHSHALMQEPCRHTIHGHALPRSYCCSHTLLHGLRYRRMPGGVTVSATDGSLEW